MARQTPKYKMFALIYTQGAELPMTNPYRAR